MDDWVRTIPSIEGPGIFGLRAELPMTVLPTAPQLAAGAYGPTMGRACQGSGCAASSWLRVGLWILPVVVRGSCAAVRKSTRVGTL
jgi:hypothetical protein